MRQGFFPGMPAEEYHSDPCERPSLNYSTAKAIINESPWHAWKQHPRLGGESRSTTAGMDKGSIAHAMLLGQPLDFLEVLAVDNFRTKKAKEQRTEAKNSGKLTIKEREYCELVSGVDLIRRNLREAGIVLNELCELTALWEAEEVPCRTRIDHISSDLVFPIDLKCTEDANPKFLERHIVDMCYDIQGAAITEAIEKLKPELEGRIRFADVFIEVKPPHFVVVAEHTESMLRHGRSRWNRARQIWKRCIEMNQWDGFANHVLVHAPNWAISKEFGEVA